MIDSGSWDQFLKNKKGNNFLQSWFWGNFQQELGKKVWRLRVGENETLAQVQIIEETLPFRFRYLYLPFGPIFKNDLSLQEKQEVEKRLLKKLRQLGRRRKAVFLRIEPWEPFHFTLLSSQAPSKRVQPQQTLILDLRPPLEKILKKFSVRSRYNIRLAQRKELKLIRCHQISSQNQKYFSEFKRLIQSTSQRKHFHSYPSPYYQKLLTKSLSEGWGELFLAQYQGKIIGAYFVVFFHQQAVCLHGAVDYHYRSIKVSHFLQWEQIKAAKQKECVAYDFWGIDKKLWPGVTFFKKSFGGKTIQYPPSLEISFKTLWYSAYRIYQKLKRKC